MHALLVVVDAGVQRTCKLVGQNRPRPAMAEAGMGGRGINAASSGGHLARAHGCSCTLLSHLSEWNF